MEEIKKLAQVHKILDFHVQKNPDNVSLSIDSISYTNSEVLSKVLSLVGLLKRNKVTSGDRIAFLAKNSSEFIELMYASSILELVMVPINFRLAYEEVKFIIQDSGSKIIIFGEEFKELVEKLNADKTDLHISFGISELRNLLKSKSPSASDISLSVNKDSKTPLFQMYTSGTTGNPKGALISQKGIMSLITNGMNNLGHLIPTLLILFACLCFI